MRHRGRTNTMTRARARARSSQNPKRLGVLLTSAALTASVLTACSQDEGTPTLTWYVNPDGQETLQELARSCSTDNYTIRVQLLPASATDQRTQLARRLAAKDSSTDLMSLDPVFVPEFASAGWLAPFTGAAAETVLDDDVLAGAAEPALWDEQVVVAPQWANTQVLWFRRSLAEAAGLDPSAPMTWEQIISAAERNDATVGVQANKYEGYMVWINALVAGAGGAIVSDTEAGRDAKVEIDSDAGRAAASVIQQLADSSAAQPDLTVSNEGTGLGPIFPADGGPGAFGVNWTFVYKNFEKNPDFDDLGWARYPATTDTQESRPPIGGIDIGVGAYSDHPEFAQAAAVCVSSPEAQEKLAVNHGLMPSRASVYDSPALAEAYPEDLLQLFRESIEDGGPRPASAFYTQISGAVQSVWHSPTSVDPDRTPRESADFLSDVLQGRRLL